MINKKVLAYLGLFICLLSFVLVVIFLFGGCAAPKTQIIQANQVINQDLCDKAEICAEKMVAAFNIKDLKDQETITEASCKILAFACTAKEASIMMRIHIVGTIQEQCINATITVEGGIEYRVDTDTCQIRIKSTTYDALDSCDEEKPPTTKI